MLTLISLDTYLSFIARQYGNSIFFLFKRNCTLISKVVNKDFSFPMSLPTFIVSCFLDSFSLCVDRLLKQVSFAFF